MRFIADLHIHSKYSRATSKDMSPESIWKWAQLKGITVIGTGDFTHPKWFEETFARALLIKEKKGQKQNCWEFKKCGREPGGVKVDELGICPATTDTSSYGLNGGKNAGRICWAVAGTFCCGKVQGSFARKRMSCLNCDLFKLVMEEDGVENFVLMKPGQVLK